MGRIVSYEPVSTGKRQIPIGTAPVVEARIGAVLPTGAVSIGPFEVSRRRDGRGDLLMGFQCVADGL